MKTGMEEFEVELYAWVFMPNHYHLVIRTHRPNLSQFMHYLNTAYTVWVNRKYRRTGIFLRDGTRRSCSRKKAIYCQ